MSAHLSVFAISGDAEELYRRILRSGPSRLAQYAAELGWSLSLATEALESLIAAGLVRETADGLVLVVPEYNHSFPGLLKHVLDTNLEEYIHKAAGVCGVSAGPFGGARMIQSLLPVLRELGLVTIFTDVYFGSVQKLFDTATGEIAEPAYAGRVGKFLDELVWMARALRCARENFPSA
jgi:NAD(P)H-dependent FMN reductase